MALLGNSSLRSFHASQFAANLCLPLLPVSELLEIDCRTLRQLLLSSLSQLFLLPEQTFGLLTSSLLSLFGISNCSSELFQMLLCLPGMLLGRRGVLLCQFPHRLLSVIEGCTTFLLSLLRDGQGCSCQLQGGLLTGKSPLLIPDSLLLIWRLLGVGWR